MDETTSRTAPEKEWPRPVPVVGDRTSAAQRAAQPRGWAMPEPLRDAVYQVIEARRDIRRFRPDPVPDEVLERLLWAAHSAPSVGHSQPWRFLVVRDPQLRDTAAVLTDRERLRQAALLDEDAARRLLDLQLEGVREAPLGIVVLCDRRAPATGILGRATFPDADLWSCAAAIQNLWLAARAEGLGLGWVTLFRPEDLADLVGIPDGVVTLGWLCLGWPDERPPEPGLQRAGWSRRLPLSDVVLTDRWPGSDGHAGPGEQAGPGGARGGAGRPAPAPPRSRLRAPSPVEVVGTRDAADRLLTPPGSLGLLDRAVDRVIALGQADCTGGTLVIVAADHPVARHGISAYEPSVTGDIARAAVEGTALGARAARGAGLDVIVVDAGVAAAVPGAVDVRPTGPRGDLTDTPALTSHDVATAVEEGRLLGHRAARHGLVALGEIGIGNTTVAAAVAAVLLDVPPESVIGLGAGADSAILERKLHVVTSAVARACREGVGPRDPSAVLASVGGPEFAVLAGITLGAAQARSPVVLDGLAVSVAALVATLLEPAAQHCLIAGHRSREAAHAVVLRALGCEPLLDLRLRAGEGAGAALASALVLQALRLRRDTARTVEAPFARED